MTFSWHYIDTADRVILRTGRLKCSTASQLIVPDLMCGVCSVLFLETHLAIDQMHWPIWTRMETLVLFVFRVSNFRFYFAVFFSLCGLRGGGLCALTCMCAFCAQAMVRWAEDGSRSKSWVSQTTRAGCTGRKRVKAFWVLNGRSTGLCWRRQLSTGTPPSWWVLFVLFSKPHFHQETCWWFRHVWPLSEPCVWARCC